MQKKIKKAANKNKRVQEQELMFYIAITSTTYYDSGILFGIESTNEKRFTGLNVYIDNEGRENYDTSFYFYGTPICEDCSIADVVEITKPLARLLFLEHKKDLGGLGNKKIPFLERVKECLNVI